MKFPQLPIGQAFRWRDQVWCKTGPLFADLENGGGRQIIPRSAEVEPLGDGPPVPGAEFSPEAVRLALDALVGEVARVAGDLPAADADRLRGALAAARQGFLDRLGL